VKLGQGRENAKDFLKAHPEIANEIEATIRSNVEKAAELAKASLHPAEEDDTEDEKAPIGAVAIAEAVVEETEEAEDYEA